MAITTLDGVISGLKPTQVMIKAPTSSANNVGQWISSFYQAGYPRQAAAPTPGMSGASLTSYDGQVPFKNPASGTTYLAAFRRAFQSDYVNTSQRTLMLVDRLWHNSGIDRTLTTAQTINSVTWPARDLGESTDGAGVYVAVEISTTMGSGTPTITISYTNSAGTSGRTGISLLASRSGAPVGHWFPIGLDSGDLGVRSIQSVTLSASWGGSGVLHLVAYRPIAIINACSAPGNFCFDDALTLGMPELWNNSVPQLVSMMSQNGSTDGGPAFVQYTQG
jgi:hypothetical protein